MLFLINSFLRDRKRRKNQVNFENHPKWLIFYFFGIGIAIWFPVGVHINPEILLKFYLFFKNEVFIFCYRPAEMMRNMWLIIIEQPRAPGSVNPEDVG